MPPNFFKKNLENISPVQQLVVHLPSKQIKVMRYTRTELQNLDTIEQAWDGDELKIDEKEMRVWLVLPENRAYNGDYVIEFYDDISGKWDQQSYYFNR